MTTEPLPESVTPEALTLALRRSGVLGEDRVSEVTVESARATVLSRIARLRLTYDGDASGAPPTLILKTALPERLTTGWGRQEAAFYAQVGASTPSGLLPRCFGAEWNAETNHSQLLLEDLSDTHRIITTWPLPPTFGECEAILRVWARFHAHWWDDPRLGSSIGHWGDAEAIDHYLRRVADKLAQFEDRLGDRMPRERRDLYALLLDQAPRLVKRTLSRRAVTIVHGSGTVSCRATAEATFASSIGTAGASASRPTTSPT